MVRRPFDPTLARGGPPTITGDSSDGSRPMTVSQLCGLVVAALEAGLPGPLRVIGEVSNASARNHWYFSLKDEAAVVSCVVWASAAAKLGPAPKDGEQIIVRGTIGHYAPQGRTQMYVTGIERVGAGVLEQRFRALCEQLRGLGYFDDARKRPLPFFPRRVAVITSRSGAAIRDVIATAAHRSRAVELLVIDARVQGDGAAADVASAIRWVNRHRVRLGVDVLLVTRGGGSIEDLWAFNEREIADAVYQSDLPVVAAIGHESDTTIIELVADVRAATPTQAVMRMIPDAVELLQQVAYQSSRLALLMRRRLERERQRVESLGRSEFLRRPHILIDRARTRLEGAGTGLRRAMAARLASAAARLERLAARLRPDRATLIQESRLEQLGSRLDRAIRANLAREAQRLDWLQRQLSGLGPESVLARGFSYTLSADGRLIRSINDVSRGAVLRTRVSDGEIASIVGETNRRRQAERGRSLADQMDLFDSGG